jgi:predicted Mrr-cat superfamily restriction endonuclease
LAGVSTKKKKVKKMTVWLCRAGLKGEYENKFIDQNKIFLIGSVSIDLTGKTDMEELMRTISRAYPTEPDGSVTTMSVQARAFATKAKVGDWIILPNMGDERLLNIGEITGGYEYDGKKSELKHSHTVDWKYGAWKRDSFDEDIIRSVDAFDSFMMFFKLRQEKRIKEIVSAGEPFAKVKVAVPKKSVNKPEAEPMVESEPVFTNSAEITEVIAEIRDTITQVRKSNINEIAEVKKMIAEVMDVIEEVRATITEVKKATLTEAAEVKKVIAEVRDALEGSAECCCHDHVHTHEHDHDADYDFDDYDDGGDFTYRLSFFDSLRARRRFRR